MERRLSVPQLLRQLHVGSSPPRLSLATSIGAFALRSLGSDRLERIVWDALRDHAAP